MWQNSRACAGPIACPPTRSICGCQRQLAYSRFCSEWRRGDSLFTLGLDGRASRRQSRRDEPKKAQGEADVSGTSEAQPWVEGKTRTEARRAGPKTSRSGLHVTQTENATTDLASVEPCLTTTRGRLIVYRFGLPWCRPRAAPRQPKPKDPCEAACSCQTSLHRDKPGWWRFQFE